MAGHDERESDGADVLNPFKVKRFGVAVFVSLILVIVLGYIGRGVWEYSDSGKSVKDVLTDEDFWIPSWSIVLIGLVLLVILYLCIVVLRLIVKYFVKFVDCLCCDLPCYCCCPQYSHSYVKKQTISTQRQILHFIQQVDEDNKIRKEREQEEICRCREVK